MYFDKAKKELSEAVELDKRGLAERAVAKYALGIEFLLQCLTEFEEPKRNALNKQIEQYMSRAETLKAKQTIKVEFLEQRRILENSTGHSYEAIFSKCLDNALNEAIIDEPWLSSHHQVSNFVRFCELLIRNCPKLSRISLSTQPKCLTELLEELRKSLLERNVELSIKYRDEMHDREIRFDNGWLVKMGRGLDIYKNVGRFTIGSFDYSLRPCKATVIDIFKIKMVVNS